MSSEDRNSMSVQENLTEEFGSGIENSAVPNMPSITKTYLPERHPKCIQDLLNLLANNVHLTPLQYNTVIRYLSRQRDEQLKIQSGEDAPQSVCVCNGRPINVLDLPDLVTRLIFSFLRARDLVNVQNVCKSWRATTMDTKVWKNAPLYVDQDMCEEFDVLPYAPYAHTVHGYYEDGPNLFSNLMHYLTDLRRMDITVLDAPKDDLEKFLKKFPNIEFIQINDYTSGFVDTLDILSACPNLKGLSLMYYEGDKKNFTKICNAIADGFPTLRELEISNISDYERCPSVASDMLRKKIIHLTHLSFSYKDIDPEVLEVVFKSTKLEKLKIFEVPDVPLNFIKMTSLKFLSLFLENDNPNSSQPEKQSMNEEFVLPQKLECIKISPKCSELYKFVINYVTTSLPHVRVLDM